MKPCNVPGSVVTNTRIAFVLIGILLGCISIAQAQQSGRVLFDSHQLEPTNVRVGFAVSVGFNPYSQRSVDQFWYHAETDFRSSVLTSVLITSFGNIEHSMRTLSEFAIYDGPIDSLVVIDSVGVQPFTVLRVGLPASLASESSIEAATLDDTQLNLNELIVKTDSHVLDSLAANLPEYDLLSLLPSQAELTRQQQIGAILVDSLHQHMAQELPCNRLMGEEIGYEPVAADNCWYVRGQAIYSRYDPQRSYVLARQDALSRLSMFLGNRVRSFVMVLDERSISTDYQVSSFLFTDISISRVKITESYVDVVVGIPLTSIIPIN